MNENILLTEIAWVLIKNILCGISVGFMLVIWFETEAFQEYATLFRLDGWLKVRAWRKYVDETVREEMKMLLAEDKIKHHPQRGAIGYWVWLRREHNCFITRLVVCPYCLSVWMALAIGMMAGIGEYFLVIAAIAIFYFKKK